MLVFTEALLAIRNNQRNNYADTGDQARGHFHGVQRISRRDGLDLLESRPSEEEPDPECRDSDEGQAGQDNKRDTRCQSKPEQCVSPISGSSASSITKASSPCQQPNYRS